MISLAIAFGLKLYPAVYGLVLIKERKWAQSIRAILYGIITIILPLFFLGDGFAGLKIMFSAIGSEQTFSFGLLAFDYSASGILKGINSLLSNAGININDFVIKILSIIIWIIPIIGFFVSNKKWKQFLYLTMAVLLFSSQGSYGLCWFLIPLLFFFKAEDKFEKNNVVQIICMILLVINIPVFYEPSTGLYRMPFYHILFTLLIIMCLIDLILKIKQRIQARNKVSSKT